MLGYGKHSVLVTKRSSVCLSSYNALRCTQEHGSEKEQVKNAANCIG